MTVQCIGARAFLLLENMSVLAIFGNELRVTPECEVQNALDTVNGLNYSNDSHHRREIIIHSILKIRIIRCLLGSSGVLRSF
jgi:hypothetical protein